MADRIQLRGDTEANWISVNPILADREIGIAKDVGKAKVGDGVSTWTALPYMLSFEDLALLPNAAGNANKFSQVNSTGDGWLAQTAEEHREAMAVAHTLTATINRTVGATGDYPTVNEALEDLSKKYQHTYKNTGVRAVVTMQSGFALAEQLIFDGIDMSWITLTSIDAEVPVVRSALTIEVLARYPVIAAFNGGQSCYLNFIGAMDSSGVATNRDGLFAVDTGSICGMFMGIKGAGHVGAHAVSGGSISCYHSMYNSGAGVTGAECISGGRIVCRYHMDNSGAGAYGAYCAGGGYAACRLIMDNLKGETPATSDTQVLAGGYIARGGGSGGTSQTPGEMTTNGYISQ